MVHHGILLDKHLQVYAQCFQKKLTQNAQNCSTCGANGVRPGHCDTCFAHGR
ncbi:hypothetical protein F4827_007055 [Paraburkholderia bannensis]|uniref:Uncharacterized protein n=1 Tax=Paraburkholderia bannensis TaxID=765414 RepID=A0A7W9WXE2_9BURK|nr:hypothetical protein [Paraburkholderia sp. WP4_3_2]MBB6107173.1 hypothetical protein [Paraburkholderia bannensis]